MNIVREMHESGLSKSDIVWEVLGALSVFALPIIVLFVGSYLGLK
jgi:hypothetical protein